jgi:hypothetical protein
MNPDLVAGRGQEESREVSSGASSSEAQFESSGGSSGDSAALVETTDEAHLRYAKLPVDHWVHPWSLPAIKARTSYALEVALTLRELCSKPDGQTKQQSKDLQVQFHHHMQAKWGSTRGTAAECRQKEVYAADHQAHEDYQFLLADLKVEFPSLTANQLHSKIEKKLAEPESPSHPIPDQVTCGKITSRHGKLSMAKTESHR